MDGYIVTVPNNKPADLNAAVADELTARKAVKRGVTNEMLAQGAGISTRQVMRMFRGTHDIGFRHLLAFCEVLGTTDKEVIEAAYKRLG